jgi:hypothetical protein
MSVQLGSIQISETSSSRPSTLQAIGVFFWFIVVAMCADNLLISWKKSKTPDYGAIEMPPQST